MSAFGIGEPVILGKTDAFSRLGFKPPHKQKSASDFNIVNSFLALVFPE